MKKQVKKPTIKSKPGIKKRKTHPQIIITGITALILIVLALFLNWIFIFPAVYLWWMNKKYIKKHFGV